MFYLMLIIFVLGYAAIALEHPLKIDKSASALLIGVLTWVVFIMSGSDIVAYVESILGHVHGGWESYIHHNPNGSITDWIGHHEILHHLGEISEILFFLLGAMTIVEIVDQHEGFKVITDKITTTKKVKLLWILSILTFFMSAALDNLTTTIVMVALLRKLVEKKEDRWFFASMIILAANAGGAWSPIGDVTTIMLWVKGQVTTIPIIRDVFLPSVAAMVVPLIVLSFILKGNIKRPDLSDSEVEDQNFVSKRESILVLIIGVGSLLFVPVFKNITHLPPYLGMLLGLGNLWVITEIIQKRRHKETNTKLTVVGILTRVDVPTVLFFLGILLAVASLQSAGHLTILANFLDEATGRNIYIINLAIGLLSSIVDNVPLVAGAMGMYSIEATGFMSIDGQFWQFLAYCAGTGGSILIIGSAAGVAAMGMEKIDFIWYMKKISLLAMLGYFAGAGVYYLMFAL
ncbi:MAG: sodium:proton antiporter NhaD [Bacteroidota bacterium]|nr:sodium:proton antiporter NhaD [Bacteroidota bacterium]